MRRREGIQLFKEICKCIPDAFISSISLSQKNMPSRKDFELKINVALDGNHLRSVETLVSKHGFLMKEHGDSLVIYGSKTKTGEMQVFA